MGTINNVGLKALKHYVGHEGICYQGNVYVNSKKVGFWSQDSWGGPDDFDFDTSILDKAREDFKSGHPNSYVYKEFCDDIDIFMSKVLEICLIEKDLRKGFKTGHKSAIHVTDGSHSSWVFVPDDGTDKELLKKYSTYVDRMKSKMYKNVKPSITVFHPGMFDIIVNEDHPAPGYIMMV